MVTPCLTAKPQPDRFLVTAPSICTVHFEVLVICRFLGWKRTISQSVLPAGHFWQSLPKFSGRSVSQRCWNHSGYLSHSLVCSNSVSWYACRIDSGLFTVKENSENYSSTQFGEEKKRKLLLITNLLWIHGGTSSRCFLDALKLRKVRATNLGVIIEDIIHQVELLSMLWMQTDWLVKRRGPDKVSTTAKQTGWSKGGGGGGW